MKKSIAVPCCLVIAILAVIFIFWRNTDIKISCVKTAIIAGILGFVICYLFRKSIKEKYTQLVENFQTGRKDTKENFNGKNEDVANTMVDATPAPIENMGIGHELANPGDYRNQDEPDDMDFKATDLLPTSSAFMDESQRIMPENDKTFDKWNNETMVDMENMSNMLGFIRPINTNKSKNRDIREHVHVSMCKEGWQPPFNGSSQVDFPETAGNGFVQK